MTRRNFVARGVAALLALLGLSRQATAAKEETQSNAVIGQRREPLFLSAEDARQVIEHYCVENADDAPLTPSQVELLVSRLKPQFWIAERDGAADLGTTRFGGAPDLPTGTAWPIRPALPVQARKAAGETRPSAWIVRQLGEAVPFEFVAQIDLAETALVAGHADGLPKSGRLLFFVDTAVLMHQPSGNRDACHLRFDETPAAELTRLAVPDRFEEMENWWRAPDPGQIAHLEAIAESLEAQGFNEAAGATRKAAQDSADPDPAQRKPFVYPSRAMKLIPIVVLPARSAIELSLDTELRALADGEDTSSHYGLMTSNDAGPFTADERGIRRTQDWLTIESRRNRLLGPTGPEQDDPRFDAIPESEHLPYPWNEEQAETMSRKAVRWRLLLQVTVAGLAQETNEGTLYFMVHEDDLVRRDFSRCLVTYQQT